jgi:dipeptide transport system substrate-binding protein
MIIQKTIKTGVAGALLAALATLTVTSAPALAAKTLVFCSEASPEGFNPQFFTTGPTSDAGAVPMYNRLVQFEHGSSKIVTGLAESWSESPDGLVYTFKLRKGVKFHSNAKFKPTRDFNADDVLFSYNRMADPKHPFSKVTPGQTYAFFEDMGMNKMVDRVEKVDDYTVRFILKKPEAPFIANVAMNFMSILSSEYADKMKAAGTPEVIDREPIGTGPFQFVSYQKDATIRYQAFDAYWDGRPKVDKLIFSITPDPSVRLAKLKANECQMIALPKPADIESIKKDINLKVATQEGLNIGYIAFNVEKKPFDNKLVRQALNMAIDKKSIMNSVYLGAGIPAKNLIPPTMWSYNDKVQDYPYDLVKAKELLTKAGFPNGFEMDLWYLPVSRPYNPDGKRMAELLQADWAKIGVKVKLVTYEWGEYKKRSKTGEQQAMMFGWSGDNGDPDNFFATNLSCDAVKGGGNSARWCNKEFEDLIQKAKHTANQAERTKLYEKAQVVFKEEAPWITIAHSLRFTPMHKDVQNFKMAPTAHHYFDKVDIGK